MAAEPTLKYEDLDVTQEFLGVIKEGSSTTYQAGLAEFQLWWTQHATEYGSQDISVKGYFDVVDQDKKLNWRDRKRIANKITKAYVTHLKTKFKAKTVRTYAGALQSLGKYLDVPFTLKYAGLPVQSLIQLTKNTPGISRAQLNLSNHSTTQCTKP